MKICPDCNENKALEAFHKNKYGTGGLRSICKSCTNSTNRQYYLKNKETVLRNGQKWDKSNPDLRKGYSLKSKYGITLEMYQNMFSAQNGCCAICKIKEDDLTKSLAVDHDHKTGQIRGLLCDNCNRAIGLIKDSVITLQSAVKYLEQS